MEAEPEPKNESIERRVSELEAAVFTESADNKKNVQSCERFIVQLEG